MDRELIDLFVEVLEMRKDVTGVGAYVAVWAAVPKELAKGKSREDILALISSMCEGAASPANHETHYLYILGGNHNTASNRRLWLKYKGTPREDEFAVMTCCCWNSNFFVVEKDPNSDEKTPPIDDGLWVSKLRPNAFLNSSLSF